MHNIIPSGIELLAWVQIVLSLSSLVPELEHCNKFGGYAVFAADAQIAQIFGL